MFNAHCKHRPITASSPPLSESLFCCYFLLIETVPVGDRQETFQKVVKLTKLRELRNFYQIRKGLPKRLYQPWVAGKGGSCPVVLPARCVWVTSLGCHPCWVGLFVIQLT